jgi:hypothetical protein
LITYRTLDTGLEVIRQSRRDSGPWNCTTVNTRGSIFKVAIGGGSRGSYPIPSRCALCKSSLNKGQKAESTDSQQNVPKGGVIRLEFHDAKVPGLSMVEREHTLIVGEHIRMPQWRKQAGHGPMEESGREMSASYCIPTAWAVSRQRRLTNQPKI